METQEIVITDALEEFRRKIRHCVEEAAHQETTIPETEWLEIVEVLRRRFNALGMIERSTEVDEFGMDALAVRGTLPTFDFLLRRYWRSTLHGVELIPSTGPALFAVTSFAALPCDVLMVAYAVYQHSRLGADGERLQFGASHICDVGNWVRFLMAPQWVALPFVQAFATRLGGLSAGFANAQRLLSRGHRIVCSCDEHSALEAAIDLGVPIIPVELRAPLFARPSAPRDDAASRETTPTENIALWMTLRELGLFALPIHWSLHFHSPIVTRDLSRDVVFKKLHAQTARNDA